MDTNVMELGNIRIGDLQTKVVLRGKIIVLKRWLMNNLNFTLKLPTNGMLKLYYKNPTLIQNILQKYF
jgi:hypothetical protein